MKKLLFILLLIIPFFGFGQNLSGSGWKIQDEDGDRFIILFDEDGTFTILNVIHQSGNQGRVFGDDDETWEVDGNKVVISRNDGYQIYSGTINRKGDYMWGMKMNKKGISQRWSGELIKFSKWSYTNSR